MRTALAAGASVATTFVAAVALTGGPSPADTGQFSAQIAAIASGHLARAFPIAAGSATPPGFGILAALLGKFGLAPGAVGVACALLLAAAATLLADRLTPSLPTSRRLVVFAATLALPAVWDAIHTLFHPQDLLAMALVCLALAAACRSRWALAGGWLGAAVVTKQWAILAALPVLACAPAWRARRQLSGAALAVGGALLAPFALADPSGTLRVLRAQYVSRSEIAFVAHLPIPGGSIDALGRIGPLLVAASIVVAFLSVRRLHGRGPVDPSQLVTLALACLAARPLLDPTLFPYYLVPVSVLLLVVEARHRLIPVITLTWVLVTTDLLQVPGHSSTAALIDAALLFGVVLTVAVAAAARALGAEKAPYNTQAASSPEYLVTRG